MKKINKVREESFTGPLLSSIIKQYNDNCQKNFPVPPAPSVDSEETVQPDLYQDAGGGYNANFTFPQD